MTVTIQSSVVLLNTQSLIFPLYLIRLLRPLILTVERKKNTCLFHFCDFFADVWKNPVLLTHSLHWQHMFPLHRGSQGKTWRESTQPSGLCPQFLIIRIIRAANFPPALWTSLSSSIYSLAGSSYFQMITSIERSQLSPFEAFNPDSKMEITKGLYPRHFCEACFIDPLWWACPQCTYAAAGLRHETWEQTLLGLNCQWPASLVHSVEGFFSNQMYLPLLQI